MNVKPKHLKAFWNRKSMLFVSLLLIFVVAVGTTTAWLTSNDGPVSYQFEGAFVDCQVLEDFSNNVKSNVRIENTGNTSAYIRAFYVANWVNEEGDVYPVKPKAGTEFALSTGGSWTGYTDQYYYYDSPVEPNEETPVFIVSCTQTVTPPEGYHLQVTVLAEAIQALPNTDVVAEAWWNTRNQAQTKPVPAS